MAFIDKGQIVAVDTPANLTARQGKWALDCLKNHDMETQYFNQRESANAFAASHSGEFTFRRVNLEDAFLALTGKKVI